MDIDWHITALSESDAIHLCSWVYPPPYNINDWSNWDVMIAHGIEFGDPTIRVEQYRAVRNQELALCGFIQLFPMVHTIRLGVGLRPDLCDKGFGKYLLKLAIHEARCRSLEAEIDLEVHTWNTRAIKTYQKVGFMITDRYVRLATHGLESVYCMVFQGNPSMEQ